VALLVTEPHSMIFEAKITSGLGALLAVRAAVGQLFEYRRFLGPRGAHLCILLDSDPGQVLVDYVERDLALFIMWTKGARLSAGEVTRGAFPALCES
jgi:hypothetical protein